MRIWAANSRCRAILPPLWAGLLIVGSLAPPCAAAEQSGKEFRVRADGDTLNIAADDVSLDLLLQEIARQSGLRLVQHVALTRSVSLDIRNQALPVVLDSLLNDDSYLLYRGTQGSDAANSDNAIPGTLWIFSAGSSLTPAATLFLEAVLLHGDFEEKQEALRELRRLGTPAAVQALSLALGDDDSRVRDAAFEALSRIGSDEALAAIASATTATDAWTRSEAANALASSDSASALQYLELAFTDPDPRVRAAVVEALGDIPGEQAASVLSQALRDSDADVRMHAIEALERIGDDSAFRALMQAHAEDPGLPIPVKH
ncbi:MAG: HEAT repeat domain-containing protein [Gammaproteobacteria bacterium]|nr:HEAT repeat domain-containing protein [Gammaproteobacteria bacterium]